VSASKEAHRCSVFARQLGKGQVRLPRRHASPWALSWTPERLGGLATKPEYAVESTDRFLTSLARIQVEIQDKLSGVGFAVRRSLRAEWIEQRVAKKQTQLG